MGMLTSMNTFSHSVYLLPMQEDDNLMKIPSLLTEKLSGKRYSFNTEFFEFWSYESTPCN